MCGISGLLQRDPQKRLQAAFLKASAHYLHRRGPDSFAHAEIAPGILFAHARLSIIDLEQGNQPMKDPQGAIVYNGEIYNYQEKQIDGVSYRTSSDTEVLLKGLHAQGISFLQEADGMFAFAYYNRATREITLARDLFGIKPLYYFFNGESFAFASRMQPLMLLSKKDIDRQALVEYYATRAARAPRTIFADIVELPAGHALTFNVDDFSITSIVRWAQPLVATRQLRDEKQAIYNLEQAMQLAIRRHMVSDVPVASFLSGGVDSSLITAMAAQQNPEITAFSVGFSDPRFDESRYASAVCQRYRLRHHVRYCDHTEFMNYVESWPDIMDDVVADPSAVMLALVAETARELGYKVVLSGEGADEIFAGYNQHHRFVLAKKLAAFGKFAPFAGALAAKLKPEQSRYIQFAKHASVDPHFYGTGRIFEPYLLPEFIDMQGLELEKAATLSDALALDLDHRLPDDILTRTDRATMHASIEARVPFLTRYVWDVAGSLDESLLINGRMQKYILKKLAEKYVPHECLYRKKVGFDLPLAHWLRGPLREYMMDNLEASWQDDYLRPGAMRGVTEQHLDERNDNADKIWAFLLLENNVRALRGITLESIEQLPVSLAS